MLCLFFSALGFGDAVFTALDLGGLACASIFSGLVRHAVIDHGYVNILIPPLWVLRLHNLVSIKYETSCRFQQPLAFLGGTIRNDDATQAAPPDTAPPTAVGASLPNGTPLVALSIASL